MILGPVFERFINQSPISVMSRATLEHALSATALDELFERTAERGYTRELLFSTTVDVMSLVEYAVLFSIVVLPLTYLPLMLLAGDKSYMREHANRWLSQGLGWLYFAIVTVAAIAAIPLYLLTSGGQA